jgi:ADP-ribose pyrophosphatase YjhB (NUDIX family)
LVEEGRLLLGQRREGAWCIPCGYLEGDEEPAEGARREFREETGLEVEILGVRAAKTNRHRRDQRSVGLWFNGVRLGGKLEAKDDLRAVEWFLPHEIPHLAFPTDEEVIAQWRCQMSAGGEAGA